MRAKKTNKNILYKNHTYFVELVTGSENQFKIFIINIQDVEGRDRFNIK